MKMNRRPLAAASILPAALSQLPGAAWAQPNSVRVLYSREMPRAVRAKMPHGFKSRFFGTCKLPSVEDEVLAHLSSRAEYIPGFAQLTYRLHHFTLDLFVRGEHRHKTTLRKLNTITFDFKGGFDRVRVDVMWIDPKTRHIPVFRIQTRFLDAPRHGFDVLIPFPKRLTQQANAQVFESRGNNSYTSHYTFNKLDNQGLAVVTQTESSSEHLAIVSWIWDGEKFVASKPEVSY